MIPCPTCEDIPKFCLCAPDTDGEPFTPRTIVTRPPDPAGTVSADCACCDGSGRCACGLPDGCEDCDFRKRCEACRGTGRVHATVPA